MNFDIAAFGRRLQALRKAQHLTQVQLAMNLNISTQHLSNIEIGQKRPSIELMVCMASYFQVSLDFLILGSQGHSQIYGEMEQDLSLSLIHLERIQHYLDALEQENPLLE